MMPGTVFLFLNIGTGELMLIFFVALLLFGGEKLPGLARGLGRGIRDFKNASEDVKREINNQINTFDDKKERKTNTIAPVDEHSYVSESTVTEEKENLNDDNIVDDTNVDSNSGNEQEEITPEIKSPANTVEYKS